MAEITSAMVKELRERSGSGMMDCKKALDSCGGDMEKAADFLREKGLSAAAKKAGRVAAEGICEAYIHMNGSIGVLVEINCETDFVAKTDEFKSFAHDVAMHIAAASPQYLSREEVPADKLDHEIAILKAQAINEGKPEKVIEKMVSGRIEKFYSDICLLEQAFVKDPDISVTELVNQKVAKIGEKITIRRFVRYQMGEGLEKRQDNFAEEVMAQMQ